MEKEKMEMSEKLLNIALEIIQLLTEEDCIVIKKNSGELLASGSLPSESNSPSRSQTSPDDKRKNDYKILRLANKIIELLTGEAWGCIDEDKDEIIEVHQPLSSPDGSSTRNSPQRGPGSPDSQDCAEEEQNVIDYSDDMECIDLTLPKKRDQEKTQVVEEKDETTERILNLTLEIIFLLTGEDCVIVKKTSGELVTSRNRTRVPGESSGRHSPVSPLSLVHNKKEQRILEVAHKIIELLTGEQGWESDDDDYKEEVIQDQHTMSSDGSSNIDSPEGSPSPHYSQDCLDDHHNVTRVYQEKKEKRRADDEVIHVTIKEEDYPADIGIDGRRIRRTSDGCLILSCDVDDSDVVQDSIEDDSVTIDVHPGECTERALDLSNTGGSSPEIITHTVGNIVLNPGFDGFYVQKPKRKPKPKPEPKPQPQPKQGQPKQGQPKQGRRRKNPIDEKRFQCCECGKFFPHKSYLIKHERSHTGEKPFICSECGKCFTDNSGLMKHVRIHLTERPYQCCSCGKGFTYKADLIKHERIHTGEKPFPCSKCGKCFTDKSGRAKHERIHSGEKPFPCPICGKCFSRKSHMHKHQIIHTGEKPFLCQECGRCFGRKSHLTNHQILHRGEKPYMCPECGKCFAQRPGLIIHRKIHKPKVPPVS
ncbi:oocyte zinc finger protein XlCOF7.1-like isoform X2 [Hyperolius riggenbachi]|uniref:oocyte zinc finger protein XlCOF7.1-like isoform X2 n=1 Tax=Hyperolius riggenbachi TaxID=752182 RepID=UPI0035A39F51